jgi:hypothetical protein
MSFESPLPEDFRETLKLRNYPLDISSHLGVYLGHESEERKSQHNDSAVP